MAGGWVHGWWLAVAGSEGRGWRCVGGSTSVGRQARRSLCRPGPHPLPTVRCFVTACRVAAPCAQVFYCWSRSTDCVLEVECTGRWRAAFDALRAKGAALACLPASLPPSYPTSCLPWTIWLPAPSPVPEGNLLLHTDSVLIPPRRLPARHAPARRRRDGARAAAPPVLLHGVRLQAAGHAPAAAGQDGWVAGLAGWRAAGPGCVGGWGAWGHQNRKGRQAAQPMICRGWVCGGGRPVLLLRSPRQPTHS